MCIFYQNTSFVCLVGLSPHSSVHQAHELNLERFLRDSGERPLVLQSSGLDLAGQQDVEEVELSSKLKLGVVIQFFFDWQENLNFLQFGIFSIFGVYSQVSVNKGGYR